MTTFDPATPDALHGPVITIGESLDTGVLKIGTFLIGQYDAAFRPTAAGAGTGFTSATPDILP